MAPQLDVRAQAASIPLLMAATAGPIATQIVLGTPLVHVTFANGAATVEILDPGDD